MRFILNRNWFIIFYLIPTLLFAQNKKPNIIFILTDDQRWDALGIAGNTIIQTPQMDALATSGTYFKNAFSTTPICAASRASILTGLYERTHGYTFQKPNLREPYAEMIYPKIFKDNGYHVGFFGKLGVNINKPSQYFDESDFYDRGGQAEKPGYFYKKIGNDTVHLTRYSGYQAQNFIKNAPTDQPFCLSISFSAPHGHDDSKAQYFWQEKSDSLYKNIVIPDPILGNDSFFKKLPIQVQEGFNRTRWKWRFDTPEKYQSMVKGYYRMITEIDDEIGLIRKQLKEKGIEDNTIIIVMGDNGYFLGERQFADKWLMYDKSLRVPMMIYDPRNPTHRVIEDEVLNIDIAPTIFGFAGLSQPKSWQGVNLSGYTKAGSPAKSRVDFLCEHLWKVDIIASSEGFRTKKWKYFRYREDLKHEELYDLSKDPLEKTNLVNEPKFKSVLIEMRQKMEKKIASLEKSRL